MLTQIAACAALAPRTHIDPRTAAEVEVSKNNPPPECGYLGPVKGSAFLGDLGEAQGDAVRNAVMGGGNYVAVDLIERPMVAGMGGYGVQGRLFICPKREKESQAWVSEMPTAPAALPAAPEAAPALPAAPATPPAAPAAADEEDEEDEIVVPKAICAPACGQGQACEHGVCVKACEPACGAGARCGEDGVCHVN